METFAPTTTVTHFRCSFRVAGILRAQQHTSAQCSFAALLRSPMRAKHENTSSMVCFRVRRVSYILQCMPSTKTPTLVCFRVRHVFYALECTPSMKQHPGWCFFMFDAFPVPSNVRRARNHTLTGVFSCSAPVLYLRMQRGGFSPPRCCIY